MKPTASGTLVKTDLPEEILSGAGISTKHFLVRSDHNIARDFLLQLSELAGRVKALYSLHTTS